MNMRKIIIIALSTIVGATFVILLLNEIRGIVI
jgi:hypothetical protein